MERKYWGYHLPGLKETDINLSMAPSGYANLLRLEQSADNLLYPG